MSKCLILVKHSVPEVIENVPAREWKLSEEGLPRAEQLAHRLIRFQPEVIVSSKEPKAKETAESIAKVLALQFHVADNLHEHDRGNVPYLSREQFRATVEQFFDQPDQLVFGQETANQSHDRFSQALQTVMSSHPDKTVVLVAHGTVISLFVSRLLGVSGFLLWSELGLPSYIVIDLKSRTLVAKENIP